MGGDICNYHFRNVRPSAGNNITPHAHSQVSVGNATTYHSLDDVTNINFDNATSTAVVVDDSSEQLLEEIEMILLTRVVIAICAFGVLGNIVTLVLLIHRRWQHSKRRVPQSDTNVARADILGLICLSLSDLLFCVSILPHATADFDQYTYVAVSFGMYFKLIENGIINTFIMTSTWLTVSMTINRYAHLCHPILGLRYFGSRFMVGAIVVSTGFSIVFNLPRFWYLEVVHMICVHPITNTTVPVYGIAKGIMKEDYSATVLSAYQWGYFIIGISIPLCILAYCNCRIVHAVYNSMAVEQRRNKERNIITKILICIVIFYLLLVSPAEIIKFFSGKIDFSDEHRITYNFVVTVLNTFQAVNFSCNFIPYVVLNKKFRYFLTSWCRKDGLHKGSHRARGSRYESVTNYTDTTADANSTNCINMYALHKKQQLT